MRYIVLAAALASLTVGPALAQSVNSREARQEQRIEQGVASGALTPGEASKAQTGERRIERQEHRMRERNGGRLTPRDRARLEARLERQNHRIRRLKHNGRRTHWRRHCEWRHHARRCWR